jgi:hypothetical protein
MYSRTPLYCMLILHTANVDLVVCINFNFVSPDNGGHVWTDIVIHNM